MMTDGTTKARSMLKSAYGEGVPKMEAQKTSSAAVFFCTKIQPQLACNGRKLLNSPNLCNNLDM